MLEVFYFPLPLFVQVYTTMVMLLRSMLTALVQPEKRDVLMVLQVYIRPHLIINRSSDKIFL